MNFYRADADQQSLDSTIRMTFDFGMRRKAPEVGGANERLNGQGIGKCEWRLH